MANVTSGWMPMSPAKGPPLPKSMEVYWPWVKAPEAILVERIVGQVVEQVPEGVPEEVVKQIVKQIPSQVINQVSEQVITEIIIQEIIGQAPEQIVPEQVVQQAVKSIEVLLPPVAPPGLPAGFSTEGMTAQQIAAWQAYYAGVPPPPAAPPLEEAQRVAEEAQRVAAVAAALEEAQRVAAMFVPPALPPPEVGVLTYPIPSEARRTTPSGYASMHTAAGGYLTEENVYQIYPDLGRGYAVWAKDPTVHWAEEGIKYWVAIMPTPGAQSLTPPPPLRDVIVYLILSGFKDIQRAGYEVTGVKAWTEWETRPPEGFAITFPSRLAQQNWGLYAEILSVAGWETYSVANLAPPVKGAVYELRQGDFFNLWRVR